MTPEIFSGAALVAALCYLPYLQREESWLRSGLKTLPLSVLALGALILEAPLLALALAFSALGDLVLSRKGQKAFLFGLISFALAHLLYIPVLGGPLGGWQTMPLLVFAVAVLALSTEVWLRPHVGALKWPVRAYVLVIFLMAASAFGHGWSLVALGAALFVASDFCLAIREFRAKGAVADALAWMVWFTYMPGQILIFYGMLG